MEDNLTQFNCRNGRSGQFAQNLIAQMDRIFPKSLIENGITQKYNRIIQRRTIPNCPEIRRCRFKAKKEKTNVKSNRGKR